MKKKKENKVETKLVFMADKATSFWGIDRNGKQTLITLPYNNCEEQDKGLSVMTKI